LFCFFCNLLNVKWGSAAATTNNIYPTLFHKVLSNRCHELCGLVIVAKLIRQTCIRMSRNKESGFCRQLFSSKCAVKADTEQRKMRNRNNECLKCLTCKGSTAGICDCTRHHYRKAYSFFFKHGPYCKKRSLTIKNIKNGFNQKNINTTINQPLSLFGIRLHKLVKSNRPCSRIVDLGRH